MERYKTLREKTWLTVCFLFLTGAVYSLLALALSGQGEVDWGGRVSLFLLNTLPVWSLLFLLWLATGWSWLASLVTGGALFLLAGGNYFKVAFRSTPLLWSDLHNLQEAGQMAEEYEIALTPQMHGFLLLIVLFSALLFVLGRGRPRLWPRVGSLAAVGLVSLVCFYTVYPSSELYSDLAGEHALNHSRAYAACGLVYPFLHSFGEYSGLSIHYDEEEAKALLDQYQDEKIPVGEKVSLVAIQLEAFADLSRFDIEGIHPKVYGPFHDILEESYSGTLVTDVFAGGTTETEWAVLTGGNLHGDFQTKTNSVAWYLKDQGYLTGGGHPSHAWFYDRATVNPNLGLDDYLFLENYYSQFVEKDADVAYDNVFFPDLEDRLNELLSTRERPVFSFNVTYQGHGPYATDRVYWGRSYCTGDYPSSTSNALNNYFYLIHDTSRYLTHLLDFLEAREEPVVLLLYGDHMPWMGIQGSIYESLGINLDTSTEEGFLNYYSTWYAIWGNPAAKQALGQDFEGEGPDLSPCFLMNEVFALCGWEGSAYMQAQREVAEALPVLHTTGWVLEDGSYTLDPSPDTRALMDQFQAISRYDRTRWE